MGLFCRSAKCGKAVKALYYSLNKEIWSHSISRMLSQLDEFTVNKETIEKSKELDRAYIGSRSPDYYTEGSPLHMNIIPLKMRGGA